MRLLDRFHNRAARVRQHRWRMRSHRSPEAHVVIGGSPRSGTTLLRRTFDRHPDLCCGPESSLFLPGALNLAALAAGHDLPVDELRGMLAGSASQGAFIDAFAARYRLARGRGRWAEKTPLNIRHLDWIMERFPEARIIHVLRDGRDVVCSMREHPDRRWVDGRWVKASRPRPIEAYARRWVRDTAEGMRWRGDPRYIEVRYEDLVRDPAGALTRVLGFLGEPFEPTLLPEASSSSDVRERSRDDTGSETVRPDAAGAISTASLGRWRRDLAPADQQVVRRIAGSRLIELGYAADDRW